MQWLHSTFCLNINVAKKCLSYFEAGSFHCQSDKMGPDAICAKPHVTAPWEEEDKHFIEPLKAP